MDRFADYHERNRDAIRKRKRAARRKLRAADPGHLDARCEHCTDDAALGYPPWNLGAQIPRGEFFASVYDGAIPDGSLWRFATRGDEPQLWRVEDGALYVVDGVEIQLTVEDSRKHVSLRGFCRLEVT